MKIVHEGYEFNDDTDWAAYLRKAADTGVVWGLRNDLELTMGLSELASALKSAPALLERLADAALSVLETGDQKAIETIQRLPYEAAPDAHDRLLRLVEQDHARLQKLGVLDGVFDNMCRAWRADRRIRHDLAVAAARYPLDRNLARTAALWP